MWRLSNNKLDFSSAYHPQTDRQTEVVNRSLGDLLRSLVGDHLKSWDHKLFQAEFAYSRSKIEALDLARSLLSRNNPRAPLDLVHVLDLKKISTKAEDWIAQIKEVHKALVQHLQYSTAKYKANADKNRRSVEFEEGDFVWAVLIKDRFPMGEYKKLVARKIGLLEIIEIFNPNAYQLKLPSHIKMFDVFNAKHLVPYIDDANSLQPGEDDVDR